MQHELYLLVCIFVMPYFQCGYSDYARPCLTPENRTGICTPIRSCVRAYSMLKNYENLDALSQQETSKILRKLRCDLISIEIHVCCLENDTQINPDIYNHLSQLDCGKSSKPRISHGERASLFDFRWSALLIYHNNKNQNTFLCGGSLITERYVLTAAHCSLETIAPYAVRLGEYDLTTDVDCIKTNRLTICAEPHEDIEIENFIKHEEYINRGFHHDIAVIRLVRAVQFSKSITPICLPITRELQLQQNEGYLVSGWGRTENSSQSNVLVYTYVPHQSLDFCYQTLSRLKYVRLTNGHICAGGERFQDSCKGDSGGAMFVIDFYVDGAARSIQHGIVSIGVTGCGVSNTPAIYTNISHYMQWITDKIRLD